MLTAIADKSIALSELCRRYGVARLELFGSATTESFDPARSDLDFIVDFRPGQDLGPWLSHYFAFRGELVNLFGRPVDLVMRSAIRNAHFLREANKTRRMVYEN